MGSAPASVPTIPQTFPTGSSYLGGQVTGPVTYSAPPGMQPNVTAPNAAFPPPAPGSAPMGTPSIPPLLAGLWTGAMLGSMLSQYQFPGGNALPTGPMAGGMMPFGAPSPFGPSGFTPGLRGGGAVTGPGAIGGLTGGQGR